MAHMVESYVVLMVRLGWLPANHEFESFKTIFTGGSARSLPPVLSIMYLVVFLSLTWPLNPLEPYYDRPMGTDLKKIVEDLTMKIRGLLNDNLCSQIIPSNN